MNYQIFNLYTCQTRALLSIALIAFFISYTNGQEASPAEVDTSKKITINDVNVIKDFEAKLIDAQPISINPFLPRSVERPLYYPYELTIIPLDLDYPDPVIKPFAMEVDDEKEQYEFYLEGGYGTINNPNAKLSYALVKEDKFTFNSFIQYDALDNSENVRLQKNKHVDIILGGSYRIGENHEISAQIDSDIAQRNLYSTEVRTAQIDEAVFNRDYSKNNLSASIKNIEQENGLKYYLTPQLDISYINQREIRNTSLGLEGEISKTTGLHHQFSFNFFANYSSVNSDLDPNQFLVHLSPSYHFDGDGWWIMLGGQGSFTNEERFFWPNTELGINIAEQKVQAFVGSRQDAQINDVNSIINEVPFMFADLDSIETTVQQSIYGGARGNLGRLQYEGKAAYNNVTNYQFFNPEFVRFFEMAQVFDDNKIIEIQGSISLDLRSWLKLGGSVTQRFFDLNTFSEAWGIPEFELATFGQARLLSDRLRLRAEFLFANRVNYQFREETGTLNELFDLNLEARFTLTDHFGVYLNGFNLLDNEYRRFFGYPTVGIHGRAGAWLKF